MKTYKKIDIYFDGDYLCSTNQSKTCKEAKKRLIEAYQFNLSRSSAGYTPVQIAVFKQVLAGQELIKAYFSKGVRS